MSRLKDKIVLITGGITGIGLASAHLFRSEGARALISQAKILSASPPRRRTSATMDGNFINIFG